MTLPPLLVLGATEAALRLAGYGYSTDFFLPGRVGGREVLIENDRFGFRFFPPALARRPEPLVVPAHKPAGTFRIFILGESAALGDPEPAYGAGRYLQVLLRERYRSMQFEIINVAMTAINSHALVPIARECARREGDLWILYMGNNEMVGPFGAMTVFGAQTPPLALIRLNLAAQRLRVGQLLASLALKLKSRSAGPAWAGMEMFLRNTLPPTSPRRQTAHHHFQANLRDILATGLSSGAKIVLSTVAVNLQDCSPLASAAGADLSPTQREAFERLCAEGDSAEVQGLWTQAVERYQQAATLEARFAELQFRWGTCLLQLTNAKAASEHLQLACDSDALPFRADSKVNAVIREEARRLAGDNLVLCDAANALAAASRTGICGQESFLEHVHLSFDGNYRLARAWAAQVERLLPQAVKSSPAEAWASQARCEQQLGLTDWNRRNVLDEVLHRCARPPLSAQSSNRRRMEALRAWQRTLTLDEAAANAARARYDEALERAPNDHYLREMYADFLEAIGDNGTAMAQWTRVRELMPHDYLAVYRAGKLQAAQGQHAAAEAAFNTALAMRPDLHEVWFDLGELRVMQGKLEPALEAYDMALALQPSDSRGHAHRGLALSRLNRPTEAMAAYGEAVRLAPDFWEAHFELGLLLGLRNDHPAAADEFAQVVRLNPGFVAAHANLGLARFKQGRWAEARAQFEETLRLEPGNQTALSYLGQIPVGTGR